MFLEKSYNSLSEIVQFINSQSFGPALCNAAFLILRIIFLEMSCFPTPSQPRSALIMTVCSFQESLCVHGFVNYHLSNSDSQTFS